MVHFPAMFDERRVTGRAFKPYLGRALSTLVSPAARCFYPSPVMPVLQSLLAMTTKRFVEQAAWYIECFYFGQMNRIFANIAKGISIAKQRRGTILPQVWLFTTAHLKFLGPNNWVLKKKKVNTATQILKTRIYVIIIHICT